MNPQKTDKGPSYAEILREIVSAADGPISTEELAAQMLEKHPSTAKNPRQTILEKIRKENGRQLVYLDPTHVLPLRLAWRGARYRIRLTEEIIVKAALPIYGAFHYYLPLMFDPINITFVDSQGTPIPSQVLQPLRTTPFSPGKKMEYQESVVVLKEWFRSQKMFHKDHILVTIEDWERGIFRLERESYGKQRSNLLAERNRYFADAFYGLLEAGPGEEIYVQIALPTIYAKISDNNSYFPDHWLVIVNNDPRMNTDGITIRYSNILPKMAEQILAKLGGHNSIVRDRQYTKEEGQQIYRLRAQFTHRPSIWREIEIEGEQTLADLDAVLRTAFQHDSSDHLSGFWKKVVLSDSPRKRYREIDLGTVNPFEGGEGSDTPMASLKLKVGDQLKYVYDFGDWVEHILELRAITAPEKGANYPREIARNKMRSKYCVECQKKGKKTAAIWVCHTCSEEEGHVIVLCENCRQECDEHKDHYTDRIRY